MPYTCCPSYIFIVVISIMTKATWAETDLFYVKTIKNGNQGRNSRLEAGGRN